MGVIRYCRMVPVIEKQNETLHKLRKGFGELMLTITPK